MSPNPPRFLSGDVMTIEELKALIEIGQDCGEAEMKALWPEILALVEAANEMGYGEEACWCGEGLRGTYGEGKVFACDVHKAIDAFNAKLEKL